MKTKTKALKKGQKVAGIATLATFLLALVKGIVGMISGSTILIADAIHSGVDIITIFASWFGLRISQREPNQKFPYGYYKVENLATLVVVGFIFFAAYEIFLSSYEALFVIKTLNIPLIAISVSLISAAASYAIAFYENKVGKEIHSQSLIANAQESKADVLYSLVVSVGIILSYYDISYVEGIIGILLSFLILKIGYQNAKTAILSLMDASPEGDMENKVKVLIKKIPGVREIQHLKLRQSGTLLFGEGNIKVDKSLDINRAHEITDIIEEKIKKRYQQIDSFLIHIEPFRKQMQKVMIPIKKDNGLDSEVIGHFGRADYFFFAQIKDKDIKSWYTKKNPFIKKEVRAGLASAKYVLKEKIDILILRKIGEISFHTLKDGFVEIYQTDGDNVKDILDKLTEGRLKRLSSPTHSSEK